MLIDVIPVSELAESDQASWRARAARGKRRVRLPRNHRDARLGHRGSRFPAIPQTHGFRLRPRPAQQSTFAPYQALCSESPLINIRDGFTAYVADRRQARRGLVQTTQRRVRKIAREAGPLRLEHDVRDAEMLNLVMKWELAQYERTHLADRFKPRWIVSLVRQIASTRTAGYADLLSALNAGDHVVAPHFGMRSTSILHW